MPERNPLPFPGPGAAGSQARATPPTGEAGQTQPTGEPPRQPIAPRPQARRPLWARLLGWVVDPWLELKLEPAQLPQDERPVCFVLEDYGLTNSLILDKAC